MAATVLSDLLKPALRRGGITILPGTTPNVDQYAELIPEVNRMLSAWSCDGHKIFTTSIDEYPLTAGQKIYTIGPGGDFDNPRPIYIKEANVLYPTSPVLRRPVAILDDDEWSRINIQDITGSPPWGLYYDGGLLPPNGLANIYLVLQPNAGYSLELYTWTALTGDFAAISDAALFPPGYEDAIVKNLALCVVGLYPEQSSLAKNPLAYQALAKEAGRALDVLITLNTSSPVLRSEAANIGGSCGGGDGNYYGIVAGGSGGGGDVEQYFTITGAIDGTDGSDGNAVFTLSDTPTAGTLKVAKNGIIQTPNSSYVLSGLTISFVAPNIPIAGSTLLAWGSV